MLFQMLNQQCRGNVCHKSLVKMKTYIRAKSTFFEVWGNETMKKYLYMSDILNQASSTELLQVDASSKQNLRGFYTLQLYNNYVSPDELQTFCWNHFMASSRVTRCLLPTTPLACRFFETLYPAQSNHQSISLISS